jgi:hypothetical protein
MSQFEINKGKNNSMALVLERTVPAERPPFVGGSFQLLRIEGVAWSAQLIPTIIFSDFHTGAASVSSK